MLDSVFLSELLLRCGRATASTIRIFKQFGAGASLTAMPRQRGLETKTSICLCPRFYFLNSCQASAALCDDVEAALLELRDCMLAACCMPAKGGFLGFL